MRGMAREYAAGNSLGPGWRESAGIFGCPVIVEQVVIDRDNNVDITLAIPIDGDSPEPESVAIASKESSRSGSGWRCS